ncbi:MaoC family dehydratase N-terminal domain-containing protein [Sphingobium sp.]|uniref:FAS1-like dehydratase domain-containing protein n=1 Tax=Sphingobium sp. TaxID=1912891 RepID=UPI0028BF2624|nr:MaoC family dehydratase N-terminal domain-containing protein [Sphingobium sp.]
MSVTDADIAHWRSWIGRTESRTEPLDVQALTRYAAAIGEQLNVEEVQPSLAHWAFFLPVAAADRIGTDGHPRRGGFLPPVSLPRRMFAASDMRFSGPLLLDRDATRISIVQDVVHKSGRSGELVLLTVEHRILQADSERLREVQTIVYRDAGAATPAIAPAAFPAEADDVAWTPSTVDLFRFSAVTFNSHRIHYDLPYATGGEGYPGLVIHGPFTAAKLFGHARRGGRTPSRFSFRAVAPLFQGQSILLREDEGGRCRAIRCDGMDAMVADVAY